MNGGCFKQNDLVALGYREFEHAGFSWLATQQGRRFILEVDDWSRQALAPRDGWIPTKRRYHIRYFAKDRDQNAYFIKIYFPKTKEKRLFGPKGSRARKEFFNTVAVYKASIQSILPLALGEPVNDRAWSVIIYPFLENSAGLPSFYERPPLTNFDVQERQSLERAVGRMIRRIVDKGLCPHDLTPDHLLVRRMADRKFSIYWVDLERVKFCWLFRKRRGIKTLAKILIRMEWLRNSGHRLTRSSILRIAHAFCHEEALGNSDKKLCRRVVREARKLWRQKGWDGKRPEGVAAVDL